MRTPTRRGLLKGGLALGAAAAAAPLTTASPAHAAGTMLHVTQANIRHGLPWDDYLDDLDKAAFHSHLLGVNEGYDYPMHIAIWAENRGFHCWGGNQGDHPSTYTNVMLARKETLDPLEYGRALSTGTPDGTSPLPTYIHWARYLHKPTGRHVVHVNTHLTPGIDRNGHPHDWHGDGRVQRAFEQLGGVYTLAANLRATGAEVVVTGDFNIDYVGDSQVRDARFPFAGFEDSNRQCQPGLRSCFSTVGLKGTGTHGPAENRRYIDYVYEWVPPRAERAMWMRDYHLIELASDHDAVLAQLEL